MKHFPQYSTKILITYVHLLFLNLFGITLAYSQDAFGTLFLKTKALSADMIGNAFS